MLADPFNVAESDNLQKEMNMIPFIDILLVLLVLFIIALPVLHPSVRLDLPRVDSPNQPIAHELKTIRISLNAEHQLYWNQLPISEESLANHIRALDPEHHLITLEVDARVTYERFTQILAQLQAQGLHHIRLETQSSDPHQPL